MGLALVGAWKLGKHQAAEKLLAAQKAQSGSFEQQATIDELQLNLEQRTQEVNSLRSHLEAGAARSAELLNQLELEIRKTHADQRDLDLYRTIESSEKPRSIGVESLRVTSADPRLLSLTLVQWQGRERVRGEVQVSYLYPANPLRGNLRDGATNDEVPIAIESGAGSQISVPVMPVTFDFRFFQVLEIPLPKESVAAQSGNSSAQPPKFT